MVSRVEVRGEMIEWARRRSGLPFDELVSKFPKLPKWEAEDEHPTMRQLENYANATMAPLGYFFLPQPPVEQLPIPDFRTVDDNGVRRVSPNLLDTLYAMQRRQSWLRDDRVERGHEPLAFVRSTTIQADPMAVAALIREELGVEPTWAQPYATWTDALAALRDGIEELGVVVVINGVVGNNNHRKLDPGEFRGFVLVDDHAPLIFVNGADAKAAQMFTLAHELAHLWVGQDALVDLRALEPGDAAVERFCNRVAAEFLVSAATLAEVWPHVANDANRFQTIARRFKVSEIVVARRALDLGLISREQFFGFYNEYIEKDRAKAKPGGGDFYNLQSNRVGRSFARAVFQAVREGKLLYRDAYALTGLQGETFDRFANKLVGAAES